MEEVNQIIFKVVILWAAIYKGLTPKTTISQLSNSIIALSTRTQSKPKFKKCCVLSKTWLLNATSVYFKNK